MPHLGEAPELPEIPDYIVYKCGADIRARPTRHGLACINDPDYATVIQQAYDALLGNGGIIDIVEDTYEQTKEIAATDDGVTVQGKYGSTIIEAAASMLDLNFFNVTGHRNKFRNLKFDGKNTGARRAVYLRDGTTDGRVEDCIATRLYRHAFRAEGSIRAVFDRCIAYNCKCLDPAILNWGGGCIAYDGASIGCKAYFCNGYNNRVSFSMNGIDDRGEFNSFIDCTAIDDDITLPNAEPLGSFHINKQDRFGLTDCKVRGCNRLPLSIRGDSSRGTISDFKEEGCGNVAQIWGNNLTILGGDFETGLPDITGLTLSLAPNVRRYLWSAPPITEQISMNFTVGRVFLKQIAVPWRTTIDRLIFQVGIQTAGNIYLALYGPEVAVDTPAGAPLIDYAGSVALAAVRCLQDEAMQVATHVLEPGIYWIGIEGGNIGGSWYGGRNCAGEIQPACRYDRAGGYGIPTDPCPAVTFLDAHPLVGMRISRNMPTAFSLI